MPEMRRPTLVIPLLHFGRTIGPRAILLSKKPFSSGMTYHCFVEVFLMGKFVTIRDRDFITGQHQYSGKAVAKLVISALGNA
jgi:hypothetical protein